MDVVVEDVHVLLAVADIEDAAVGAAVLVTATVWSNPTLKGDGD